MLFSWDIWVNLKLPFLVLVLYKELVYLLLPKLHFVVTKLLDSLLVRDIVVLWTEELFERHHRWLRWILRLIGNTEQAQSTVSAKSAAIHDKYIQNYAN